MNLSQNQQRAVWRKLDAAWRAHAGREGIRVNDSNAKTAFRKAVLKRSTNLDSLADLPKAGPQFARFMAALEQIAGDGVKWTMHADSGAADAAVTLHQLREVMREPGLEERYVRGIAARALKSDELPLLDNLNAKDAETVLRIVRAQIGKGVKRRGGIPVNLFTKGGTENHEVTRTHATSPTPAPVRMNPRPALARCARCGPVEAATEKHHDAARRESFDVPTCPRCRAVCAPLVIALGCREAVAA